MNLTRREYGVLVILLMIAVVMGAVYIHKRTKKDGILIGTLITAFIIRFFYIMYTPTWERQHDVIGFNNGKGIGQAALIEWLAENVKLPDFDPRTRWGFFQPLLHHIISAAWLKINLVIGVNYDKACENIQILTLIYSMIFVFFGIRLLREMKLSGMPFRAAAFLIALHPSFILMAGSVNNDMLCLTLLIMSVFYAICWYNDSTYGNIVKTAFCIGGAMMAKLSGFLAAPAIAFLFLMKLIRSGKKEAFGYLKQFVLFGCISFPIGLFFPIRNLILFGVPLMYMPEVGEPVGDHSIISRIFDVRVTSPYSSMVKNGNTFDEFNVPVAMIKTSLTGEYDLGAVNRYITPFAWILFITGSVLAVVAFLATILYTRRPCKKMNNKGINDKELLFQDPVIRIFWLILYATGLIFYLRLAFSVPNFSSEDFRYVAYLIVPESLYIGLLLTELEKRKKMRAVLGMIIAVFGVSSLGVYFLLGLP